MIDYVHVSFKEEMNDPNKLVFLKDCLITEKWVKGTLPSGRRVFYSSDIVWAVFSCPSTPYLNREKNEQNSTK